MKEGLELIPRTEQPEWVMDGEHFAASIISYIRPLPEGAYPTRIDLGQFTPVFDTLYNTSQDVYFFTDEERKNFHNQIHSRGEPQNDMIRESREKEVERIDRMIPGERNTILYVDPDAGSIGTTPILFGAKDRVQIDFRVPVRQGYIPFSSVHTHPQEYLPSAQDVSLMLRDFGDGLRQIKSGIVLLPNSQVLIVATDKTLALSNSETQDFVQKWSGELANDPKIKRYTQYTQLIQKTLIAGNLPVLVDEVMGRLVEIEARKDSGQITEDEMKVLAEQAVGDYKDKTEKVGFRLGRDKYRAETVIERRVNQIHQEMLKEAGVKVYVSFDKANFLHTQL